MSIPPSRKSSRQSRFVADGAARIRKANLARIRREVTARFEAEWATAGCLRRLVLRWRIHRRIGRELSRVAPPGALYATQRI
jgi:hypothetical protein